MGDKTREKSNLFADLHRILKRANYCAYSDAEYSAEARRSRHSKERLLTAEEHSQMSEIDFAEHFESKEKLIKWYFNYLDNYGKLAALPPVCEAIKTGKAKHIASFGSGPSVLEYLLKEIFQDEVEIVATDYDRFIMDGVSKLLTDVHTEQFDFYHDDPKALTEKYRIDTAIMFGSACSMDNETYVRFLKSLSECGVKTIFTFEAGGNSIWRGVYDRLFAIAWLTFLYLFRRKTYRQKIVRLEEEGTSFHAYKRTKYTLMKIYTGGGYAARPINGGCWKCAFLLSKE